MKDIDLGWVAGMFEGEGCIHVTKDGRAVRLTISSVDIDTVTRFHTLVGIGHIYDTDYTISNNVERTKHVWVSGRLKENQKLLITLLPHLGERRSIKAREALGVQPNPNEYGPRVLQSHCKRGHPMTPANTLTGANARRCRTCKNAHALAAYHAKRARQLGSSLG